MCAQNDRKTDGSSRGLKIEKSMAKQVFDEKFLKVYDLQYEPGRHYFDATRRSAEDLVALKEDGEFRSMLPDAVSCFVIIDNGSENSDGASNGAARAAGALSPDMMSPDEIASACAANRASASASAANRASASVSAVNRAADGVADSAANHAADGPLLLLAREYRYPAGRYLLSVPAGLLDPEDQQEKDPLVNAAAREIHEETGIVIGEHDRIWAVDSFVFSTPGMTDESNALMCAVINGNARAAEDPGAAAEAGAGTPGTKPGQIFVSGHRDTAEAIGLTQSGAVGSEKFDGFVLLNRDEAKQVLEEGRDSEGNPYPVYTWAALMYFLSDMWKR